MDRGTSVVRARMGARQFALIDGCLIRCDGPNINIIKSVARRCPEDNYIVSGFGEDVVVRSKTEAQQLICLTHAHAHR